MFDIGFLEIVIIAAIALVVLGPERLPRAARTAGMWVGRARRMVADVKSDIDREIRESELADMRKLGDEMKNVTNEISQAADAVKNDDAMGDVVESIRESAKTLNQDVNEKPALPSLAPSVNQSANRPELQGATFMSHLLELRDRLMRGGGAVLVLFIAAAPLRILCTSISPCH